MNIKCSDIQKYNYSHPVSLISGEGGKNRAITWVHYMEDVKFIHFIKGGELLVVSGILMKNPNDLYEYVLGAYRHNASGVAIKTSREYISKIPEDVIEICDAMDFPLFSMPEEMQIIEFSQTVCRDILNNKNSQDSIQKLILDIIYNKSISEGMLSKARKFGYNEEHDHHCVLAKPIVEDDSSEEFFCHTADGFIEEFFSASPYKCIASVYDGEIIMMLDVETGTDIRAVMNQLIKYLNAKLKICRCILGVGSKWSKLIDFRVSLSKARFAINQQHSAAEHSFYLYDDLKLQKLFFDMPNQDELIMLMQQILGRLSEEDEKSAEMYSTIEAFIDNNCNLNATADQLFIHINTLRYRLKRIEQLLGISLGSFDSLFDLKLAVCIKKYLKAR